MELQMEICDPWLYTCPNFEFCEKRVDDVVHYVCEIGHTNTTTHL